MTNIWRNRLLKLLSDPPFLDPLLSHQVVTPAKTDSGMDVVEADYGRTPTNAFVQSLRAELGNLRKVLVVTL